MGRVIDALFSVVLAIPRFLYRRIVVEEQRREAERQDLREIRDELIGAAKIQTMANSTTPAWRATREACVRAAGLAAAGPDPELRDQVRAFREAFDAVANNWTRHTLEQRQALRDAFDQAMERIAILLGKG